MTDDKTTFRREEIKSIDWNEVNARLEQGRDGIEQALTPLLEGKKKILKARARELAREPEAARTNESVIEVVELILAQEAYAIESSYVTAVFPLKGLTPLPGTPPFVRGLINIRGQIMSVIDLRMFFGLPAMEIYESSKVAILSNDEMEFGILTDEINGVRSILLEAMQTSLIALTGKRAEYLRGVMNERLAVLDAEKILSDRKIVVHDEVES